MQDLGTLGGANAYVQTVSGSVVVGQSETADGAWHAFAYDLGADLPVSSGELNRLSALEPERASLPRLIQSPVVAS